MRAPTTLALMVRAGSRMYQGGEAGEARWMISSKRWADVKFSTSCTSTRNRASLTCARLLREPVHRLSTTTSSARSPRSSKRSTICEPIKPQPPETSTLRAMNLIPLSIRHQAGERIAGNRNIAARAEMATPSRPTPEASAWRKCALPVINAASERPLWTRHHRGGAATGSRRLWPEAHLFGLVDEFSEDDREAAQHQKDNDHACNRQWSGLYWLGPRANHQYRLA